MALAVALIVAVQLVVMVLGGQRLVVEQLADNLVEQAFVDAALAGQLFRSRR